MSKKSNRIKNGIRVDRVVTIEQPPEEVYRFWRNLENLPKVMNHLESVQQIDNQRSHWVAKGPAASKIEWDAEVIQDIPNEMISWQSVGDSTVYTAGSVHFMPAPGNRGTEVKVSLQYDPPGGSLGATVAKLFGKEPSQQITEDLRRLKQLMETGENPTIEGQPQGS